MRHGTADRGGRLTGLVDPGAAPDGVLSLFPDAVAIEHLDAIVITHAHADHSAGLPAMMAAFPTTPVLATPGTMALLHALGRLPDAALARARSLPFYESDVVASSGDGPPWTLRLLPAGHLLGAAMVVFETPEGCVVCSGDVHLSNQYTVRRAARPRQRADVSTACAAGKNDGTSFHSLSLGDRYALKSYPPVSATKA